MIDSLEQLVNHGRYLEASELAGTLRKETGHDPLRVDQLLALSLAKTGAPESALTHLEPVYQNNPDDPETAGILGGIYKQLFKKYQDTKYAILSRDTYLKNFNVTRNYYTGINAATMASIAGRGAQGREIASQVISLLEPAAKDFWEYATLGEAYLLTRNREKSIELYVRARKLAGTDWGRVISVHDQLWLIEHYESVPKDVMKLFAPPGVVSFIGHMVDHPDRTTSRFPPAMEDKVSTAIKGAIRTLNVSIGYCSLACGSDILFAEAMEEAGGELNIFLPFAKDDFIEVSVRFAGHPWEERFERLLKKHPGTLITDQRYAGYDDLFTLQSKIILGSSILRSLAYHRDPTLLTVLSETDLRHKEGGTRSTIGLWPLPNRHTNINPDHLLTSHIGAREQKPSAKGIVDHQLNRPVLYLVYADLSRVAPLDKDRITKAVNARINDEAIAPKAWERGADSILILYAGETGAIDCAQQLWNVVPQMKGERSLKIGLHAGPVHLESRANSENKILEGKTVELIRMITQFAPVGSICASDHFASLLALNSRRFQLDYAGLIQPPGNSEARAVYKAEFRA